MGDALVEIGLLRCRRQLAIEEEIAGLEEVALFGELLDRVPAIKEDSLVAVDVNPGS